MLCHRSCCNHTWHKITSFNGVCICWISIKTILTRCDLGDLFNRDQWYRQSTDEVVSQVRQRLVALERRQCQQDAETMSRMRLYRALHPEDLSQTPNYITSVALSRRQRSALAKLRMGTLPLALETGRYVGRPVEERVCRTCDLGAVERERLTFYLTVRDTMR